MRLNEFKDRLFNVLNETNDLHITDIIVNDKENEIKLLLDDHSSFIVTCRSAGSWFIQPPTKLQ